jgi:hypothetical protein
MNTLDDFKYASTVINYCQLSGSLKRVGEDVKPNFKWWVLSPISLPALALSLFISW